MDWSLRQRHAPRVAFVRRLIDLRRSRLWLRRDTFLKGTRRGAHAKDVTWLHPTGREMTHVDWNDSNLRSVAVHMNGATSRQQDSGDLLVVFNADEVPVTMALPAPPEGSLWAVVFDTAVEEDDDRTRGRLLQRNELLTIDHRSTVLLESQRA
ncbi:MAG: glycogen debranching enzyme GlgX [Steroidobacteraceae bacterium]|nr:glycogen debranching enzyme GlgX [Steroidobacteraceae bacterium]